MAFTVVRFDLVDPAATPGALSARYRAALEMSAYADENGIDTVQTEEHHGAEGSWLPSPFVFAGSVFGATRRIAACVRGPGPDLGAVRRALPARGAHVRAEDVYRVVTPEQCAAPDAASLVLHPLRGGMPLDEG